MKIDCNINMHMQTFTESFRIKLEYHTELNPKLWNDGHLNRDITSRLISIAREWQEYALIPNEAVKDIIITGGNVNYNYTEQSDIDVHLVCDWSKMPIKDNDILMDFLFAKKDLWARKHNIKILGYPVELFAQPEDKKFPDGQGVYSILHDKWVVKPQFQSQIDWQKDLQLRKDVFSAVKTVNALIKAHDVAKAEAFKNSLHASRGTAIQNSGEFAHQNLIYKDLRNRGYLDKLSKFIQASKDRNLSL